MSTYYFLFVLVFMIFFGVGFILLHKKFEHELEHALAGADRIRRADMQHQVRFGIGWGIEFRFEKEGSLEKVQQALASVPPGKRVPILDGINWGSHLAQNNIVERTRRGERGDHDTLLIRRLQAIYEFAHAEKRRLEKGPVPSARPGAQGGRATN